MKIVLSGGWGYGNLGDDAILLATLKNIYLVHPNAEICILSTNMHETYFNIKEQFPNVNVQDSFHTMLFGNVHEVMYKPVHNRIFDDLIFKIHSKFGISKRRDYQNIYLHMLMIYWIILIVCMYLKIKTYFRIVICISCQAVDI